jgi:hypothetical protein
LLQAFVLERHFISLLMFHQKIDSEPSNFLMLDTLSLPDSAAI